jgi:peptidoglycan hydrolase CwlO-like protein
MDSSTILTTVAGAIAALAPALLLITSHYKKLRDDVIATRTEFQCGITAFKAELTSGLQLVNQKIASIERQIADQQKHVAKLQDDHVRIAERLAVAETQIQAVTEDVKTHSHP